MNKRKIKNEDKKFQKKKAYKLKFLSDFNFFEFFWKNINQFMSSSADLMAKITDRKLI